MVKDLGKKKVESMGTIIDESKEPDLRKIQEAVGFLMTETYNQYSALYNRGTPDIKVQSVIKKKLEYILLLFEGLNIIDMETYNKKQAEKKSEEKGGDGK